MNRPLEYQRELEFLQEQAKETGHKQARLQEALNACTDCLESDGLRTMLHSVQLENDVLQDLLKHLSASSAVSLEAVIIQHVERSRQRAAQLAGHWQRGHPTPAGYWDAENQRSFLLETLSRYHAWSSAQAGRTTAPQETPNGIVKKAANGSVQNGQNRFHPWLDAGEHPANNVQAFDDLHQRIDDALARLNVPERHLDVIVQPQGVVIVTGQAHSAEDRENVLSMIMDVDGVWQVVSDVKVVAEAECPICHPPEKSAKEAPANGR